MKTNFNTFYWGENTEVRFEPFTDMPKDIPVTSCMVMAVIDKEYLVLSSPKRGWGLPGGHLEKNETPQIAAIRELREEAGVSIDKSSLRVVGGWLAKKIRKTPQNSKYPDLAYQLLFIANVTKIDQFPKRHEVIDRYFVPIRDVLRYSTGVNFKPIFNYIVKEYSDVFVRRAHVDKVSIIVPFHNTEKYIKKCLASIAQQSYKNIEVLLVDDGSTDGSAKVCDDYAKADNRFTVIRLKKHTGTGAARSTGLDFISGNYVCFIDSDDYVDKDFVSKLLSAAIKYKADIAECRNYCVFGKKVETRHANEEYASDVILSSGKSILRNYLTHASPRISNVVVWNKIYRADLFKNNHLSFDYNLKKFDDSDLVYRLYAHAKKHVFITDVLYSHVHRENSIMRSLERDHDSADETQYVITKMLAYFHGNKEHYADALMYIRWNLTHSMQQNLPDGDLARYVQDHIISPSKALSSLYKKNKEADE